MPKILLKFLFLICFCTVDNMQNLDNLIQLKGWKNSKVRVVACFASLDMVSNCAWSISVVL